MFERFVNVFTLQAGSCMYSAFSAGFVLRCSVVTMITIINCLGKIREIQKNFSDTAEELLRLSFVEAFLDAFTIYVGIAFAPSVEQRAPRIVCVAPRSPIGAMPRA